MHPIAFQLAQRQYLPCRVILEQPTRTSPAALPFHPLRHSFLNPGGSADRAAFFQPYASRMRFLRDEAVRKFVLERAGQILVYGRQSLHWNSNSTVVERARP